jgi:hypothetical protein
MKNLAKMIIEFMLWLGAVVLISFAVCWAILNFGAWIWINLAG